ncbi:hypothetical protein NSQ26_12765 [Bacillus sp. FSL W7-1360]
MYVKVYPKADWDEQETKQQMRQLDRTLKQVVPRYDVHVRR